VCSFRGCSKTFARASDLKKHLEVHGAALSSPEPSPPPKPAPKRSSTNVDARPPRLPRPVANKRRKMVDIQFKDSPEFAVDDGECVGFEPSELDVFVTEQFVTPALAPVIGHAQSRGKGFGKVTVAPVSSQESNGSPLATHALVSSDPVAVDIARALSHFRRPSIDGNDPMHAGKVSPLPRGELTRNESLDSRGTAHHVLWASEDMQNGNMIDPLTGAPISSEHHHYHSTQSGQHSEGLCAFVVGVFLRRLNAVSFRSVCSRHTCNGVCNGGCSRQ
jgi:hypothetical protein